MVADQEWRWVVQQLTLSMGSDVIILGDFNWLCDDLLRLVEGAALCAEDSSASLQLWGESLSLLGLDWCAQWHVSDLGLTINFLPLSEEPNHGSLWWLIQLWYLSLRYCYPDLEWRLLWPKVRGISQELPSFLLSCRYHRTPTLHIDTVQVNRMPSGSLMAMKGALRYMLHRLSHFTTKPQGMLEQVKSQLLQSLPYPLPLAELARVRQTPVRTLQRQLGDQGTTYNQLLEEVRRSQAQSLLSDRRLTTSEISLRLGYKDAPSFQRVFRKWFGVTPGHYRQCYYEPLSLIQEQHAVSLYYAISHSDMRVQHHSQGSRVWICLKNLAFGKLVTIHGEDKDGVWRPYEATFERTLGDGFEIWSTSCLPVHDPFRFYINYRVDGQTYVDNNGGKGYCLDGPILLGLHQVVCHQLISVVAPNGDACVLVRLFSRSGWDRVRVVGLPTQSLVGLEHPHGWEWQGLINWSDGNKPMSFEFESSNGHRLIFDNAGVGFFPKRL